MSDPMKEASTISELADRYGVSQRMLRFYEQQGLLRPLIRSDRSFYSKDDELRLQVILKGRRLGFSIEEIALLIQTCIEQPQAT